MSKLLDNLQAARALIEKGWTQGCFARNQDDAEVPYASLDAVCFCIRGAVNRVTGCRPHQLEARPLQLAVHGWNEMIDALQDALPRHETHSLAEWNDKPGRTKQEVLDLFDRAIVKATLC